MGNRMELNDEIIEQIVGGAFQFYNNGTRCKVQGKKYSCNSDGQFKLINMINANPGLTEAEYLDMALDEGILW